MPRVLVIDANGQVGSELVDALADLHGEANVVAFDVVASKRPHRVAFETLDILDVAHLREIARRYAINDVYELAGLLSVTGEAAPLKAWSLNTSGLLNVLELARRWHRPPLLAVVDRRFRTAQHGGRHAAAYRDGSDDHVRHYQGSRRAAL